MPNDYHRFPFLPLHFTVGQADNMKVPVLPPPPATRPRLDSVADLERAIRRLICESQVPVEFTGMRTSANALVFTITDPHANSRRVEISNRIRHALEKPENASILNDFEEIRSVIVKPSS